MDRVSIGSGYIRKKAGGATRSKTYMYLHPIHHSSGDRLASSPRSPPPIPQSCPAGLSTQYSYVGRPRNPWSQLFRAPAMPSGPVPRKSSPLVLSRPAPFLRPPYKGRRRSVLCPYDQAHGFKVYSYTLHGISSRPRAPLEYVHTIHGGVEASRRCLTSRPGSAGGRGQV